jgi:hypothetical protein
VAFITARGLESVARDSHGAVSDVHPGPEERRLWLLNIATGSVKELPGRPAPMTGTPWRPQGTEIAYSDASWSIEIFDTARLSTRVIACGPDAMFMWPAWSPDGKRVAFQANLFSDDRSSEEGRALMSAAGLTPRIEADDLGEPKAWCWDPSSASILYVRRQQRSMGGAAKGLARPFIPNLPEDVIGMEWSSDGKWLACLLRAETDYAVVIFDHSLSRPVFRTEEAVTSHDLVWSPTSPDLLLRVRSAAGDAEKVCMLSMAGGSHWDPRETKLKDVEPVAWIEDTSGSNRVFLLDRERKALLVSAGPNEEPRVLLRVRDDGVPIAEPRSKD